MNYIHHGELGKITNDGTINCFQISENTMWWRQDHLQQNSPCIYNPTMNLNKTKRNRIIVQLVKV